MDPKLTLQGCHLFPQILTHYPSTEKNSIVSQSGTGYNFKRPHYIQNSQPRSTNYLGELIQPYTSSINTWQSTPKLKFLHIPTFDRRVYKSIKYFSNSFSHYVPVLSNSFPFQITNSSSVTSSRKHLKTHLFNSSFPT